MEPPVGKVERGSEELRKVGGAVRRQRMMSDPRLMPIVPRKLARARLTSAQLQIWLFDQIASAGPLYNVSRACRLKGPLDVSALKSAIRELLVRHEILRAQIDLADGEVCLVIAPPAEPPVWEVAVEADPGMEAAQQILELIRAGIERPMDLARGPLFRVILARISDTDHVLQVLVHHIVADLWSMGIIFQELGSLYAAFLQGRPSELPKLEIQYTDFAEWQRSWLESDVVDRQVSFWRGKLRSAPEALDLPTDRARPTRMTFRGATVSVAVEREVSEAVLELARREEVTLYMVLLAAFQIVISRWSGQHEFVVGCPIAGRNTRQVDALIGCFAKVIPLRPEWPSDGSVRELLRRLKRATLEAYANPDVPLSRLIGELGLSRHSNRHPLVQVSLHFQNTPRLGFKMPGVTVESIDVPEPYAHFDLTVSMWADGAELGVMLNYSTDLFDRDTIERMGSALKSVLWQMAQRPGVLVDEIDVLSGSERRRLLVEWNESAALYRREVCIHDLFEERAQKSPQSIAVLWDATVVTYGELNARANQLAHYLGSLGVGGGALVGICTERSIEAVVGIIAILKAGGAYLPLDPEYPAARLAHVLDDSAPVAVLVQGSAKQALEQLCASSARPIQVIEVDRDAAKWAQGPRGNCDSMAVESRAQSLAYVLYTSGSTGTPKGVMVEHRSVVNLLAWTQERAPLRERDRLLLRTPLSFDASVWELFWPLTVGAQLVLARPGGHRDPRDLAERIRETGVTVVQFVPALLESFLEDPQAGACTSLSDIFCGGGELSQALAKRVHRLFGRARLHNVYGPTEACVDSTAWTQECGDEGGASSVPIGRPIANTRVYLLDERLEPVPRGAVGEIYIGGVGVARGYLHRPGLTAQRFIASPFVPGDRLYKSGDLGRYRADASIEFVGRNDFQVKIRGFRIELGEIEACLAEHAQVRDAVVVAREDAGEKRLVAYFTAARAAIPPEPAALRAHLSAALPEYMVPAAYVRLEALPLTPNGKLDRAALPSPDGEAYGPQEYEPPVGTMEGALAKIWAGVLGAQRIGRRDNFFDLGGHSLLAVRVVSRVRQELNLEIALSNLFTHPTLKEFSECLEQETESAADVLPPVTRVPRTALLPCSYAQQRPWFLAQMEGGSEAYHMTEYFHLRGTLDEGALQRALDQLVARHESLRTTFVSVDGEVFQRIGSEGSGFALVHDDFRGLEDNERRLRTVIQTEGTAAFDLEKGPLIRGRLIRHAVDEYALLITMHHMISDGWSVEVFMREMSILFTAFRRGETAPLEPLTVQYADYVAWQRRWLSGDVLAKQSAYWRQALANAPSLLDLPADYPRPDRQDYDGVGIPVELDEKLAAGLKEVSRRRGMTLFMTVLAAWALVLSRVSGQKDIVIGTPTANRRRSELEDLIGFFVNTLALRVDLSGDPTIDQLLERVKLSALRAQENQDLPFEQVVEIVAPPRSAAFTPLFQVMFAWHNNKSGKLELPGVEVESLDSDYFVAKFDLTLHMWERGGKIVGGLEYATALFQHDTAERYVGYLIEALRHLVTSEDANVSVVPLLSAGERQRQLVHWNDTGARYRLDRGIHELIEEQAQRDPDRVAVAYDGRGLSYGELNAKAGRLAHALISRNVGPEDLVGLAVSRSPDMVVGVLAILKAGAAYVPFDPEYPAQRLAFMFQDARPRVVITNSVTRGKVPIDTTDVLLLEDPSLDHADPSNADKGRRLPPVGPEHAGYVCYTSGSTGTPKGVVQTVGVLRNLIAWHHDRYPALRGLAVAQLAPISFDVSLQEMLFALTAGMTLCIPADDIRREPAALVEWLARNEVSALFAPSVLIESMCDAAMENGTSLQELKRVFQAGEPLRLTPGVRAFFSSGKRELHNHYGPTETHVVTAYDLTGDPLQWPGTVPIGRPIANTRVYLLDECLEPVPRGAVGEIYIGGVGVARGYLHRPGLTAQRFIASPFVPGDRLYKSGDLGRYRADASIEFVGRNDFQVKIRGFRIELGEIEACLAEHAQVRDAVVVAREDAGEKRLVAYFTAARAAIPPEPAALRAHLSAALPEYMVPAAYVRLEALPLTPNGKLDRAALPSPDGEAYGPQEYEPPVGTMEEALAKIWAGVLGAQRIGRRDNFFDLGGHSLLAVRVVSRVRQELNLEIALSNLFTHPTLMEFSECLEQETEDVTAQRANS